MHGRTDTYTNVHAYAPSRLFRVRAAACMRTQWCTYAYLVYTHADAQITSVQRRRKVEKLGEHRSVRKSFCFTSVYTSSRAGVERERIREISRTYLRAQRSAAHSLIAPSHFLLLRKIAHRPIIVFEIFENKRKRNND